MFYSNSTCFKAFSSLVVSGLLLVSMPAVSEPEDTTDQMHKRMWEDRSGRMGYGGMGMMGQGMGCGGMGMMGQGMGSGGMGMMGHGMGMGGMNMRQLDKKQRDEVRQLQRQQRAVHFKIMTEMMTIRDELMDKYDEDVLDAKAIGKIYARMFEQKRKMIEQSIETRNKIRALLNKEQRSDFDQMHRGGMMGDGAMGMMR